MSMLRKKLSFVVLASILSFSASGLAATITFTPGANNAGWAAASPLNPVGANCCGVNDDMLAGLQNAQTYSIRSNVRFPSVSSIGATPITAAYLRIARDSREANAVTTVFDLSGAFDLSAFPIACCSSNTALYNFWNAAGTGTSIGVLPNSLGYVQIDVTSAVQAWQAAGYANAYGFGLVGIESPNPGVFTGDTFFGASSASPPQLLVTIPEPSSVVMLGLGALGLFRIARRRRA